MSNVTANRSVYARYSSTVNKYTVTWSIDGVETTEQVAYGTVPTHSEPTKDGYTFT